MVALKDEWRAGVMVVLMDYHLVDLLVDKMAYDLVVTRGLQRVDSRDVMMVVLLGDVMVV